MDDDFQHDEWEGGPLETGPVDRAAPQPAGDAGLDDAIQNLEFNEPEVGEAEQPEIADEGVSPIPHETDAHLGETLETLETDEPFSFAGEEAATSDSADVGEVDTGDYTPPETLGEYLKSISKEPEPSEEKEPTARQKRGMSRVPGGNPQPREESVGMGSMDQEGSVSSLEDADIRNRDTMAKGQIDHMRRIEEITERLIAART